MAITLADRYYFKAEDAYPWDLEEAMENLEYALSYDNNHPEANRLMGCFYRDIKVRPGQAEDCFIKSLCEEPTYLKALEDYILLTIKFNKLEQARKLLAEYTKMDGAEQSQIFLLEGMILEKEHAFDMALQRFEQAILFAVDPEFISSTETVIERINKKLELKNRVRYSLV
jgi:tetratricopeptide (TPR) repeat protein